MKPSMPNPMVPPTKLLLANNETFDCVPNNREVSSPRPFCSSRKALHDQRLTNICDPIQSRLHPPLTRKRVDNFHAGLFEVRAISRHDRPAMNERGRGD